LATFGTSTETPYRKVGLLYQKWRDYFGQSSDDILVVQGPSTTFNPTLTQSKVDAAIADDPEGARSEWEATWRADLAAFLDEATVDAAIDYGRPLELPPRADHSYFAFCDPSGGRHDAFTICIGHEEGESFHDLHPSLKGSDDGIMIRQYPRGLFQHGVIPESSQTKAEGISSPGTYEAILMWPRNDGELRWSIMSDWTCR
jgi:hypothetical protein